MGRCSNHPIPISRKPSRQHAITQLQSWHSVACNVKRSQPSGKVIIDSLIIPHIYENKTSVLELMSPQFSQWVNVSKPPLCVHGWGKQFGLTNVVWRELFKMRMAKVVRVEHNHLLLQEKTIKAPLGKKVKSFTSAGRNQVVLYCTIPKQHPFPYIFTIIWTCPIYSEHEIHIPDGISLVMNRHSKGF